MPKPKVYESVRLFVCWLVTMIATLMVLVMVVVYVCMWVSVYAFSFYATWWVSRSMDKYINKIYYNKLWSLLVGFFRSNVYSFPPPGTPNCITAAKHCQNMNDCRTEEKNYMTHSSFSFYVPLSLLFGLILGLLFFSSNDPIFLSLQALQKEKKWNKCIASIPLLI